MDALALVSELLRRRRLERMNAHDVVIVPACEECRRVWLPADLARWRAEFLDDGSEDRLGFWCADCWSREFG
jgi:hypothetical protein